MPVISVEGLSKRYLISHRPGASYGTLRDALAGSARSALHALARPFRPRSPGGQPSREELWALRDLSFTVEPGTRLGIVGRNGGGKTTLLKILSRITEPTSGRVRLRGRVAALLEVGTGMHGELTGRENIFLNGAILGMGRAEIRRKFDQIVAFAEVERFLDTPVKRYSSGMYVRLAFSVAAHLDPDILIVDEVLAVGDTPFQRKCLGRMEEAGREGRTILFVSHNMPMVLRLCDRGIHLVEGRCAFDGEAGEAVRRYLGAVHTSGGVAEVEDLPRGQWVGDLFRFSRCRVTGAGPSTGSGQGSSLRFGEPFRVELTGAARHAVRGLSLLVRLESEGGEVIATAVSEEGGGIFDLAAGEGLSVSASFHGLDLAPGTYWVSLGARCGLTDIDRVPRGCGFEVLSLPFGDRQLPAGVWGYVYARPAWERSR